MNDIELTKGQKKLLNTAENNIRLLIDSVIKKYGDDIEELQHLDCALSELEEFTAEL